jgi:hypothetical protein
MTSQKRLNWDFIVKIAKEEAKAYYQNNGIEPTLRGLFYILVSKNVIPNTRASYNTLSRALAQYRYNGGTIHLRDLSRPNTYLEEEEKEAKELDEEEIKQIIKKYIENASEFKINVWSDQPKRIILVIEKEAQFEFLIKTVKEIFPFGVYKIVCSRGFDSATDVLYIAKEINKIAKEGKNQLF